MNTELKLENLILQTQKEIKCLKLKEQYQIKKNENISFHLLLFNLKSIKVHELESYEILKVIDDCKRFAEKIIRRTKNKKKYRFENYLKEITRIKLKIEERKRFIKGINKSIRCLRYLFENYELRECVVCYELTVYNINSEKCNERHCVCNSCVMRIFKEGNRLCPVCRKSYFSYEEEEVFKTIRTQTTPYICARLYRDFLP